MVRFEFFNIMELQICEGDFGTLPYDKVRDARSIKCKIPSSTLLIVMVSFESIEPNLMKSLAKDLISEGTIKSSNLRNIFKRSTNSASPESLYRFMVLFERPNIQELQ